MTQAVPPDVAPQEAPPERVAFKRGNDVYLVNADEAALMRPDAGWTRATDADVAAAQRRAEFANNPLLMPIAAVQGALDPFGFSALARGAAQLVGGDEAAAATANALDTIRGTHDIAYTGGQIGSILLPGAAAKAARAAAEGGLLARGGAAALSGLAAPAAATSAIGEAASAAAARAVGATIGEGATGLAARLAQRAIPGAVGGAVEAGIYGAGQAASDLAVKNEPLTAEALAASAGHAALLGAGVGGGIGALSAVGRASADRVAGLLRRETATAERSAVAAEATTAAEREAVRDATETTTRKVVEEPIAAGAAGAADAATAERAANAVDAARNTVGEVLGDSAAGIKDTLIGGVREQVNNLGKALEDAPEALRNWGREQAIKSTGAQSKLLDALEEKGAAVQKRVADMMLKELPAAAGKTELGVVSREGMLEGSKKLLREKWKQMESVLAGADAAAAADATLRPQWNNVLSRYENEIRPALLDNIGGEALAKRADELVADIGARVEDAGFERFHAFRKKFDKKIKWAGKTGESELQDALKGLRGAFEDELQRAVTSAGGAEATAAYVAGKADYEAARWIHDAAKYGTKRLIKNNSISLGDKVTAATGAIIGGMALGPVGAITSLAGAAAGAAANKFARHYGNQFAATMLTKAAEIQGIQGVADRLVTRLDSGIDLAFRAGERAASAPRQASQAARAVRRTVEETTTRTTRERDYQRTVSSVRAAASNERATAERIEQSLAPVAQASPQVARQTVSTVLRGVAFLDSKIPVSAMRADTLTPHLDEPRASQDEKARFMRYARAVNDPVTVVEDLRAGKITREGVEAVRVVYPQLYAQIQQAAVSRLADLKRPISYAQRVQLSILLGVPGDPSLQPKALSALQSTYANGGQSGGMSSPPASGQMAPAGGAPGPQLRQTLKLAQATQTATQALEAE